VPTLENYKCKKSVEKQTEQDKNRTHDKGKQTEQNKDRTHDKTTTKQCKSIQLEIKT
jgi:hypothetical protein